MKKKTVTEMCIEVLTDEHFKKVQKMEHFKGYLYIWPNGQKDIQTADIVWSKSYLKDNGIEVYPCIITYTPNETKTP